MVWRLEFSLDGARFHVELAKCIATDDETASEAGSNRLMDYPKRLARRVMNN
jgi:hypothetical protein